MAASERIAVVGGGYAGTLAATRVAGRARERARVTLVDPEGALVQRLRLHEVAVGHEAARIPLARLTGRRVAHVRGRATEVDLDRGRLTVREEDGARHVDFDRLVLAVGSTIDVGSVPGVREHAHALTDTDAARVLGAALAALDAGAVVAVAGGGLTGIELATEVAEARPDLVVVLVTCGTLGGWLSDAGREHLAAVLKRLGVEVLAGATVVAVEPDRLRLADGAEVPFAVAAWCGGFTGVGLAREAGLAVDGRGCVRVDEALRSLSHPHVLAAGDAAGFAPLPNGAAVRMTCQAGMPSAAHAADVIARELRGREAEPFDFGYLHQPVSLGRRDGLIQFVDRADRPKARILTGRRAAVYKDVVCRSAVVALKAERRFTGATRWPRAGAPS